MPKLSALLIFAACASMATAGGITEANFTELDPPTLENEDTIEIVSTISVIQPIALEKRIYSGLQQGDNVGSDNSDDIAATEVASTKGQGFRVQVFADNNQRTSQREARKKEQMINSRFPEYETYVVYNSPYWRLKVGDFKSEFQAETAADEIKRAFPEFSREVRIVRDIINLNSTRSQSSSKDNDE